MAITPPRWSFVVTDLKGVVQGEIINAGDAQTTLPLNRMATCSLKVPVIHPLGNVLMDSSKDLLLKAYRWDNASAKRLVFHGPILTAEEQTDRDNMTIGVNAVSPLWRLTKRLLGKTKNGFASGVAADKDIALIAEEIINTINGESYTGITVSPTSPVGAAYKIGYPQPFVLKNAAELLAELTASVNSYDFEIIPTEPGALINGWPQIATMNIKSYVGVDRPDAIFEYGAGQSNMTGYNRQLGREGIMTRGYITAPSWPDLTSKDLLLREDGTQITNRGLFEDTLSDGGVGDDTARGLMLDAHLMYRKNPREVVNITLAQNARPWFGSGGWEVGDKIRARAVVRGIVRFDAMFRIWGATFNVDKNGNETVTLELTLP